MVNSLFSFGKDFRSNACLNYSQDSIGHYIKGYRKAADILAHKVVESGSDQDYLVYPIVFLYRQYIELHLKYIIRESRILLSEGGGFPEHHRIKTLWNVANEQIKNIIREIDNSVQEYITRCGIEEIGIIINDFDEVDSYSFAFRYPKDKKGNKNLEGIDHINLRNLHDKMDVLAEKLEILDSLVCSFRECK